MRKERGREREKERERQREREEEKERNGEREKESVFVYVCSSARVSERERKRMGKRVRENGNERERESVCVCVPSTSFYTCIFMHTHTSIRAHMCICTHANRLYYTRQRVMSRIQKSHITHMNTSYLSVQTYCSPRTKVRSLQVSFAGD